MCMYAHLHVPVFLVVLFNNALHFAFLATQNFVFSFQFCQLNWVLPPKVAFRENLSHDFWLFDKFIVSPSWVIVSAPITRFTLILQLNKGKIGKVIILYAVYLSFCFWFQPSKSLDFWSRVGTRDGKNLVEAKFCRRVWEWWVSRVLDEECPFVYFKKAVRLVALTQVSSASVERVFSICVQIMHACGVNIMQDNFITPIVS